MSPQRIATVLFSLRCSLRREMTDDGINNGVCNPAAAAAAGIFCTVHHISYLLNLLWPQFSFFGATGTG